MNARFEAVFKERWGDTDLYDNRGRMLTATAFWNAAVEACAEAVTPVQSEVGRIGLREVEQVPEFLRREVKV